MGLCPFPGDDVTVSNIGFNWAHERFMIHEFMIIMIIYFHGVPLQKCLYAID